MPKQRRPCFSVFNAHTKNIVVAYTIHIKKFVTYKVKYKKVLVRIFRQLQREKKC